MLDEISREFNPAKMNTHTVCNKVTVTLLHAYTIIGAISMIVHSRQCYHRDSVCIDSLPPALGHDALSCFSAVNPDAPSSQTYITIACTVRTRQYSIYSKYMWDLGRTSSLCCNSYIVITCTVYTRQYSITDSTSCTHSVTSCWITTSSTCGISDVDLKPVLHKITCTLHTRHVGPLLTLLAHTV